MRELGFSAAEETASRDFRGRKWMVPERAFLVVREVTEEYSHALGGVSRDCYPRYSMVAFHWGDV